MVRWTPPADLMQAVEAMEAEESRSVLRRAEIEGMMAIVVKGDALDEASVKAAFDQIEEVDAVVSTVGGTPADARADSEACDVAHSRHEHAVKLLVYS